MSPWASDEIPIQYPAAPRAADEINRVWSQPTYERLLEVKRSHDPDDTFRAGNAIIVAAS